MYCRYAETSIWDHEQCPLNGGDGLYQRFHSNCLPHKYMFLLLTIKNAFLKNIQ